MCEIILKNLFKIAQNIGRKVIIRVSYLNVSNEQYD